MTISIYTLLNKVKYIFTSFLYLLNALGSRPEVCQTMDVSQSQYLTPKHQKSSKPLLERDVFVAANPNRHKEARGVYYDLRSLGLDVVYPWAETEMQCEKDQLEVMMGRMLLASAETTILVALAERSDPVVNYQIGAFMLAALSNSKPKRGLIIAGDLPNPSVISKDVISFHQNIDEVYKKISKLPLVQSKT